MRWDFHDPLHFFCEMTAYTTIKGFFLPFMSIHYVNFQHKTMKVAPNNDSDSFSQCTKLHSYRETAWFNEQYSLRDNQRPWGSS